MLAREKMNIKVHQMIKNASLIACDDGIADLVQDHRLHVGHQTFDQKDRNDGG